MVEIHCMKIWEDLKNFLEKDLESEDDIDVEAKLVSYLHNTHIQQIIQVSFQYLL